ncbi:MAG TPA: hypothetical protein VGV14_17850 [Rhodanobacter sp.]|nr:hypothetical protein [Rhodanobacter sp.]
MIPSKVVNDVEGELERRYGLVVGGRTLSLLLGYPTQQAFKRAALRDALPIRVFTIQGRRGKFATVKDVARWYQSLQRVLS